jgi:hypothetical protein
MYLSEEKRSVIRACIEKQQSNSAKNKKNHINGFHATEDARKVSQVLFDARDGKEVFTPF